MITRKEYKSKILKNLIRSPLNVKKLAKEINADIKNQTFKESVMELVRAREIRVIGYDFSVHEVKLQEGEKTRRIQSNFKFEGIIFRKVIREESHIYSLLNQLDDNKKFEEAKIELEYIFKDKFEEYQKQEESFYKSLLPRVQCSSAKEIYENHKKHLENIMQGLYEDDKELLKNNLHPNAKLGEEWRHIIPMIQRKGKTLKSNDIPAVKNVIKTINNFKMELDDLRREFKVNELSDKSKVWTIPDITMNEAWKIVINKYSKRRGFSDPILDMYDEIIIEKRNKIIGTQLRVVDIKGELTAESYIKIWDYSLELSEEDQYEAFNRILFYVNTHENYEVLKNHLSFALSDRENSLDYFELFLNLALNQPRYLKFQKDLGIK
jgi:hypothetical protein